MSQHRDAGLDSLPPEVGRRIHAICQQFESAWQAGEHPQIEPFLDLLTDQSSASESASGSQREAGRAWRHVSNVPGQAALGIRHVGNVPPHLAARTLLLRQLILLDLDHRRLGGETISDEDYNPLFPSGTPGWLAREMSGSQWAGRYRLEGEIGHGGMGVVYRAHDADLGRDLAVKVLHSSYRDNRTARERFLKESHVTARLQHPNIPPIHEQGELADGRPFLAMKLIRGRTLNELLKERSSVTEELSRLVQVFAQVCQGVAYAHSQGVLHRDLKPHNVMVGEFGEVQVMDWGLAKVLADPQSQERADDHSIALLTTPPISQAHHSTEAGAVMGSLPYLPPEQARGEVQGLDPRCDVFSLGAILCEILTGQPPYTGATKADVLAKAKTADLTDAWARLETCGADPALVSLCKHCLAGNREDRPDDAHVVAERVAGYQADVEARLRQAEVDRVRAEAERSKAELQAAEQRKRRKVQLALACAVFLIVASGIAFAWWQDRQFAQREQANQRNRDAFVAALGRCEKSLRDDDPLAARLALNEVEQRLPEGGTEGHEDRVERCRVDLAMLEELVRIDEFRWSRGQWGNPEAQAVAHRWQEAFETFGIAAGSTPTAEASRRVSHSLVRERLLAALDLWLVNAPSDASGAALVELLNAADPHEYRGAVRAAIRANDAKQIEHLVGQPAANEQPSRFVVVLAHLVPVERQRSILERALADRPNDLTVLMGIAETYPMDQVEFADDLLSWYRAAVAAHPRNALAWNNLGSAERNRGDKARAAAAHRRAIELNPNYAVAHNNLGFALHGLGDMAGAIAAYGEAIKCEPEFVYAHYNLGVTLSDTGDLEGAIAVFQRALELDPSFARAYSDLGIALSKQGKLEEAVAQYRAAIERDSTYAPAHNNLGAALVDLGDRAGAVAEYRKAIELDPTYAIAHNNLGLALREERQIDEAVAAFEAAIESDPKFTSAYNNLGAVLAERNEREKAIATYNLAIERDAHNAETCYNLGSALHDLKLLDRAIDAYRKAIELDGEYANAHNNLGVALDSLGMKKEAIASFRAAVKFDPAFASAHNSLGVLLKGEGEVEEAMKCFQRAIHHDPRLSPAHSNLGAIYLQQKKYKEAIPIIQAAIKADSGNAFAHGLLGYALRHTGDLPGARKALTEAARLDPEKFGPVLNQLPEE